MEHDPTTLAYLAGYIDGDGYITATSSLHSGRRYVGAVVGLSGTVRIPHDLAASLFGGNVRVYVPRNVRHRPQFQWQRYGRSAEPVLRAVLPYLRIKADQAALALVLEEQLAEARDMRAFDDPYPWMGPGYDPEASLVEAVEEIRSGNFRRGVAA